MKKMSSIQSKLKKKKFKTSVTVRGAGTGLGDGLARSEFIKNQYGSKIMKFSRKSRIYLNQKTYSVQAK